MGNIIDGLMHLPHLTAIGIVEIVILMLAAYYIVRSIKDTRAWILLKGIFIILLLYAIAYILRMEVIVAIFQNTLLFFGIIIILVLEPEIRKFIEQIGNNNINAQISKIIQIFKDNKSKDIIRKSISDNTIQEIVKGCLAMSKTKTGVLIVIENDIPLDEYIDTGIKVDADITSQLLINIFEKNTPLHDGAVVIKHDRVAAATCYLPLSENRSIDKDLGTRHRAGIGVSEASDALVVIVSEETGGISVAYNGVLKKGLDREGLTEELQNIQDRYTVRVDRRSKRGILDDLNIKISVALCVVLFWFITVGSINPITSVTFKNVPIKMINTSSIAEVGKTYTLTGDESVNVTVTDRKDVVDNLTSDKISVIADFNKLSIVNAIQLDASVIGYNTAEVTLSSPVINVSLEDLVSREFNIDTRIDGTLGDTKYLHDIILNRDSVIVYGAKSQVNKIGGVVVYINASDIENNKEVSIEPMLYNSEGELMDSKNFEINSDGLVARMVVYNTKEVPLKLQYKLTDASQLVKNVSLENSTIYIAGQQNDLEACKEIVINTDISIDINDVFNSKYIKSIDISKYLPTDIYVSDKYKTQNIIISFKEFNSKAFEISSNDIEIRGITDKQAVQRNYRINCMSLTDGLNDLTANSLKPYVDIQNKDRTQQILFDNPSITSGDVIVYGDTLMEFE